MKNARVFVTRPIPSDGLALLKRDHRVLLQVRKQDTVIARAELLRRVKGTTGLLSILTDRIDKAVMQAAGPSLKVIANYAVGFDNIDLDEAAKRGIVVTNTPDPMVNESVAEHAIALMFALAHRIVETDRFARSGKYRSWGPQQLLGTDIIGKTVGIVGTGNIGAAVVRRLYDGFGVKIIYHDVTRNPEIEARDKAAFRTLPELLREADIVSLHVPLVPATHHLIGAKELRLLKKTAFLINTSRGPVIDENALIAALKMKQLGGAGLDVYEFEPTIPRTLRAMPQVVLTPHTASATIETRQAMSRRAAQNILAILDGKQPPNAIHS